MLEHLIHVNTWYPKYEVELAEQTHYTVFNQKASKTTSSVQQEKVEPPPKKQEQKPVESKPAAADDDIDLFGSDDEEQSEETKKRLAEYTAKKIEKKNRSLPRVQLYWMLNLGMMKLILVLWKK